MVMFNFDCLNLSISHFKCNLKGPHHDRTCVIQVSQTDYPVEVGRTGELAMQAEWKLKSIYFVEFECQGFQVLVEPYGSSKSKNYVHELSHIAIWHMIHMGGMPTWSS